MDKIIVTWNGKELQFDDLEKFSMDLGINISAVEKLLKGGMTYQEIVDKYNIFSGKGKFSVWHKNIKFEADGQVYEYYNVKEFAEALGLSDSSVLTRLHEGYSFKDIFEHYISTSDVEGNTGKHYYSMIDLCIEFEYENKKYRVTNVNDFAHKFGIVHRKLKRALMRSMDPIEIINLIGFQTKDFNKEAFDNLKADENGVILIGGGGKGKGGRSFNVNGITFTNYIDACNYYDVSYTNVTNCRLRHGYGIEQAINIYRKKKGPIIIEGSEYNDHDEICTYYDLQAEDVVDYIKINRCSLEDAVLALKKIRIEKMHDLTCEVEELDDNSSDTYEKCKVSENEEDSDVEEVNNKVNTEVKEEVKDTASKKVPETTNVSDDKVEEKANNTNFTIETLANHYGASYGTIVNLAKMMNCNEIEALTYYIDYMHTHEYARSIRIGGENYKNVQEALNKTGLTREALESQMYRALIHNKLREYNGNYLDKDLVAFKCPKCGKVVMLEKYKLLHFDINTHCE